MPPLRLVPKIHHITVRKASRATECAKTSDEKRRKLGVFAHIAVSHGADRETGETVVEPRGVEPLTSTLPV